MSQVSIDAGKLDQRLEVLELTETEPGKLEWVTVRKTWAQITLGQSTRKNLFSSVGIGARDAAIVLRRQPLTLHQALRNRDQHLFVTAIVPRGRQHLDVSAALVDLAKCKAVHKNISFPAVLTEKYVRFVQINPYDVNDITYVLVTPKVIELLPGDLVECDGNVYAVRTAHVLDPFKNEYELFRRTDN